MPADGKYLGKIDRAVLGFRGQFTGERDRFGLSYTLSTEVGSVDGFIDLDATEIEGCCHEENLLDRLKELQLTLKRSKRRTVAELAGTPVEATFAKSTLLAWRVLTEVL